MKHFAVATGVGSRRPAAAAPPRAPPPAAAPELSTLYWNVGGLSTDKWAQLQHYLSTHAAVYSVPPPLVLALVETHLTTERHARYYSSLRGAYGVYASLHFPASAEAGSCGGITFYVHNSLSARVHRRPRPALLCWWRPAARRRSAAPGSGVRRPLARAVHAPARCHGSCIVCLLSLPPGRSLLASYVQCRDV